jgi:serine/threonine protein kinase/tetratricopeptide (TPR) repeat protein
LRAAALTPPSSAPTPEAGSTTTVGGYGQGFVPGTLFGRRFRIVTWLGRSDSGDVWQADDLVLQTPVALKIIRSASSEERERILTEVRLARQVTHDAARRVFDVGEVDGTAFCSMELVEGEDLAVLLRRAGRIPPERVIEIGAQLCGALAAGHSVGVLHRDVRPENVLVDNHGFVKITDFGIAGVREGAAASVHSPYTAPERRTLPSHFTEATDLYALGAVLYEMLTGRQPGFDGKRLVKPSALVPDVPRHLERTILQALHPKANRRPPSAMVMGAQLIGRERSTTAARRLPPWLAAAALAVVIGAAVLAASLLEPLRRTAATATLSGQDTIIIADVLNTTGDPVFDGALRVAVAVALEQSPFLRVFPQERVRETLQLMLRPPTEPVTRAVAREIARREQVTAVIAASIGMLGTNYVLSLEAIDARTGDVMAREQSEVAAKEDVLTGLGEAAARLRSRLGEAIAQVQQFDAPLARATTPSLEALNAYSLALDDGRLNPRAELIPYLTRAIELDPDFAMAHALLSAVYRNIGRFTDAPAHARRAFELRDRVSERERFFISWRYYIDATQAWDAAFELAEAWTRTYPREAFAFNSLGLAAGAFGDHERAIAAFKEALRLDPDFIPPYGNLMGSLIAVSRFDEAGAALDEATARGIDVTATRRTAFVLSLIRRDTTATAVATGDTAPTTDPVWSSTWQARAAAAAGQFDRAMALYTRGIQTAVIGNLRDLAAQWTMEAGEMHALAASCGETRRLVADGLELSRDNFTLERAARALALCGDADGPAQLSAELARRFPEATLTARIQIPLATAAASLRAGNAGRALALLEPVRPYDHAPSAEFWSNYLRGLAMLDAGDPAGAAAQFQAITGHRGEAPTSPLYALAYLGLGRAAAATGDSDAARNAYDRFLQLWAGADRDLPMVAAARREYTRLR